MTTIGIGPVQISDIVSLWNALQEHPAEGVSGTRTFDGKTPLAIHSIHAMCMIAMEPDLPERIRFLGQNVLLWHDCDEDSRLGLPEYLCSEIKRLVKEMTFLGGSKEEFAHLFERDRLAWLFKLYDKYSNLCDGLGPKGWMKSKELERPGYARTYLDFALSLCDRVEQEVLPSLSNEKINLRIIPAIRSLEFFV